MLQSSHEKTCFHDCHRRCHGPAGSRAVHAILVTDQGKRYYAALHLKAKADATPAQRDAILQQVIDIVYDRLIQARIN